MAKKRVPIPDDEEAQILFGTEHTCCICHGPGKDVQIHHIDSNPANNSLENLAVLCLDCHSKATGSRGLGRSYKPLEVILYKRQWEQSVIDRRGTHEGHVPYAAELLSQIDMLFCEYLAVPGGDAREGVLLRQLGHLHDWRSSTELDQKIVEGIEHVALVCGSEPNGSKTLGLPELLLGLCWQFVGSEEEPMDAIGREHVLRCLSALSSVAATNASLGRNIDVQRSAAYVTGAFLRLALEYGNHEIGKASLKVYERGLEEGRIRASLFLAGQVILLESVGEAQDDLDGLDDWTEEASLLEDIWKEFGLVFFVVSSKEGAATLSIDHPAAHQSLTLPVFPKDGVAEALPLLTPAFAHYASQWRSVMVDDPEQTDARGFFIQARELPYRIASDGAAEDLSDIASRNLSDEERAFFGSTPIPALSSRQGMNPYASNVAGFLRKPEAFDVRALDKRQAR